MLINADVKGLEVVVAAELSQDKVLCQEIRDKVDIHEVNRDRFKLGEGKAGRLIAKIFTFRLIYGGSAYSYSMDPDFASVGYSKARWQEVIDEYYDKYKGLKAWHDAIEKEAKTNGCLRIPSGRYYAFEPTQTPYGWKWPITKIKNYPVQGFGADLVLLARIEAFKQFKEAGYTGVFIQTIHDSIVFDIPKTCHLTNTSDMCYNISMICKNAVEKVPDLCREHFNYDFTLPLTSEILVGPNKKDLVPYVTN